MLIHDSVDIRAYATKTRHRTRPVDLSVHVRDRDCTVPRCHHDISELDHITDFADTHDTSVINVHGMCNANHDDKTYRDATFTRNDTHWNWWPPGTNPETTPPMTAPIGAHLTTWNLDHLPDQTPPTPIPTPATHPPSSSTDARHDERQEPRRPTDRPHPDRQPAHPPPSVPTPQPPGNPHVLDDPPLTISPPAAIHLASRTGAGAGEVRKRRRRAAGRTRR